MSSILRPELDAIAAESYEQRGILHSEMALIISTIRLHDIEVVLESGRARAQSTYLLGKYLPEVEIHSIESRPGPDEAFGRERVSDLPNVTCYAGDGAIGMLQLASKFAPRSTAVLCDGPKGLEALAIVKLCFRHRHVRLGFVHDMRRLDYGKPSHYRAAATAWFPGATFSDDPAMVGACSWLDANVVAADGPCGPKHEKEFGSYGPTVGVFVNPSKQQTASKD